MTDDTLGTGPQTPNATRRKGGRGFLWAFVAVVLSFLAGFGWQWYEANALRDQLAATQQELQIERLRIRLGQAALAAQAGDYEGARQQMSDFFTRLQTVGPTLPDTLAHTSERLLAMRDDVITGLSRANPEFAGVLYDMLRRFRHAAAPSLGGAAPTGQTGSRGTLPSAAPAEDTGPATGADPVRGLGPAGDTGPVGDSGPAGDSGAGQPTARDTGPPGVDSMP